MAMVAKQGWFFVAQPQALVSRIFKARYFPRTSFFDANIGYNPSFVWRSIWKAGKILYLGCRWSIGDGRHIKVMSEPWLRGIRDGYVSGPQKQGTYDITVNDLMLPTVKQWNMRALCDIFDTTAVEEIVNMPLLEEVKEVTLIWKEEQSGIYSVRSRYRFWRAEKRKEVNLNLVENWNGLWNIKAPSRVKHLLWRICHECLPSRKRLRQRHVDCPGECPFCNIHVEDAFHVFFGCSEINSCWGAAGLNDIINHRVQSMQDLKSIILDICNQEDIYIAGKVVVMMEVIWKNRNDFIWHNEREEGNKLGWLAYHKWQEWFSVQRPQDNSNRIQHVHNWTPPTIGWIKCNVDARFNKNCGTTNRGWCFRDDLGDFIMAGVAWDVGNLSVIEVEALALKEAVQNAINLNLNQVIFESDSLRVVQSLRNASVGNSEFYSIVRDINSLLHLFHNFEVKFIKRQANMVAHSLAKAANSWARRSIFNNSPPCIETLIMNEKS